MRRSILAAVFVALALPAFAAEETVKLGKDGEASGFLATPEGKGSFPAVVVIQEWWGLDDWVKDQARALAKQGYVALAPDLYRGKVTNKQEEAHQYMMGLPQERAMSDLKTSLDYLVARKDVQVNALGAVGWCMGGMYSLKLATEDPRLQAVVAYYGRPPQEEEAIGKIHAKVLGNYGAEDKGPSPEQVKTFETAMKKAGKSADIKIYPGAGHAFANVNNPWGGYREEAAKDAWARTIAFFDENLKAPQVAPKPEPIIKKEEPKPETKPESKKK
jgi:carboxymethylenebutenolidase